MRVTAPFAVGKDIQLDLPNAAVELRVSGSMLVVQALKSSSILALPKLAFAWRNAGMIAVVGPDHLNLIQLQRATAARRLALDGRNRSGQQSAQRKK